jgi:hypothetical protein
MADMQNNGDSKIDIKNGELLGGDINLEMSEKQPRVGFEWFKTSNIMAESGDRSEAPPSIEQGKELAGLYRFTINQPFSIDANTNYLLPMFRPEVTVERFGLIQITFSGVIKKSNGKAQRTYRLSSDRFLSRGNCMIREDDHLVGVTFLPDLAAKDQHEFSIGDDSDITYKQNIGLISSHTYNETLHPSNKVEERTKSIYDVTVLLKNFKHNRSVKVEFKQAAYGRWVKLINSSAGIIQDGNSMVYKTTLIPEDEKLFSYKLGIIN